MFATAVPRRARRSALSALLVFGVAASSAAAATPTVTITSGPSGTLTSQQQYSQQDFKFSSPSPDILKFECRIDSQPLVSCGNGNAGGGGSGNYWITQNLSDGEHTFQVKVTSRTNGVDEDAVAERKFTVAIPPTVQLMGGGTSGPGSAYFQFSSYPVEPGVRYECSIDNGAFTGCTSPFTATNLPAGGHLFQVRAIDAAGNASVPASTPFSTYAQTVMPPSQLYPPNYVPPVSRPPIGRNPIGRKRPNRVVRNTGVSILSGPGVAKDGLEARVLAKTGGLLKMVVTPKGQPDLIIAQGEQQLSGPSGRGRSVGDSNGTTIKAPFTPEGKALVLKSPRLPIDVTLSFTATGASDPVDEDKELTLLQAPVFAKSGGGRKYGGGYGVERIRGTAGGDTLNGASGNDRLMGLGGNDRLTGGSGNDTPMGGPGNDSIDGDDGDDRSFGGPGDDIIVEERFGDDYLDGGPGNDWMHGGRGLDRLSGGPGDDVIHGGSGVDVVDCGAGDDIVFVNLRSERQKLKGCETIQEEADIVSYRCPQKGTPGPETMLGSEGNDTCHGNGGADDVEGAGGNDKLYGGGDGDRMFGRKGADKMFGEDGDDELEGGRGRDLLDGGAGDDQLNGGYDDDTIRGGAGNDTIIARSGGRDNIDCGPGKDSVVADRKDRLKNCEKVKRGG